MENFHYLCYVEKLSYLTGRKLRPPQKEVARTNHETHRAHREYFY